MSKPNTTPDEAPAELEVTESQALKKLKEDRAADAEQIRQDFVRSKQASAALAAAAEKKTSPEKSGDEH